MEVLNNTIHISRDILHKSLFILPNIVISSSKVKGAYMFKRLTVVFLMIIMPVGLFAQPPGPPCAELDSIPDFTPGGAITLMIDTTLCPKPDDALYRFRRTAVRAREELNRTTEWDASISYTFTGATDGEIYSYQAQVATETDTSLWSTPWQTLHDTQAPPTLTHIEAFLLPGPQIKISFSRGYDTGSGIKVYKIYRSTDSTSLAIIDRTDMVVGTVIENGSDVYSFIDDGPHDPVPDLDSLECYYYTVVPYDKVNFAPLRDNIIVKQCTNTFFPIPPPCGVLLSTPRYSEATEETIRVNLTVCSPDPIHGTEYRFMQVRFNEEGEAVDTVITPWQRYPWRPWSGEDCTKYGFSAQARHIGGMESPWSSMQFITFDRSGPVSIDSINANPLVDGQINVEFFSRPPEEMDCGSGIKEYRLYRVTPDSVGELFPPDEDMERFNIHTFIPRDRTYFQFLDDGPGDEMDLIGGGCYWYTALAIDSLGHYSTEPSPMVQACVDKFMAPYGLLSLPNWSKGDSVRISIVDTTHCDGDSIILQMSKFSDFSQPYTFGPISIRYPDLNNPDDFDCVDIDTFSYLFEGLVETRYYFRVRGIDTLGNYSEWSNTIHTRLDNSPPTAAYVDSLKTVADSTGTIDIKLWWSGGSDVGIGLANYILYRSTNRDELGEPIDTFNTTVHYYLDDNPNPGSYFHQNYYTVVTVDSFGYQGVARERAGLPERMSPPAIPVMDSVWLDDSRRYIYVAWSDTTPPAYGAADANRYILEHTENQRWLWLGDPLLIDIEPPTISRVARLPISIYSGTPKKYFHIKAIDPIQNQSGYSQPIEYTLPIEEQEEFRMDLEPGWNLVSLPVYPTNNTLSILFPGAIEAYTYQGGAYNSVTTLEVGKGYFILVPERSVVFIQGIPVNGFSMPLDRGWMMVGSAFEEAEITTDPTDVLLGNYYTYNPTEESYDPTENLIPGKGHWVLCSAEEGTLTVTVTEDRKLAPQPEPAYQLEVILYTDNSELKLGTAQGTTPGYDPFYDQFLPPTLPDKTQSPYIKGADFPMKVNINSNPYWELHFPKETEVKWNSAKGLILYCNNRTIDMSQTSGGETLTSALLKGDVIIKAGEKKPMLAVTPNPFNATTRIEINLNEASDIELSIYDITGRKLALLFSGKAKKRTISFDASDYSSGLYFIRLEQEGITKATRKLILIK